MHGLVGPACVYQRAELICRLNRRRWVRQSSLLFNCRRGPERAKGVWRTDGVLPRPVVGRSKLSQVLMELWTLALSTGFDFSGASMYRRRGDFGDIVGREKFLKNSWVVARVCPVAQGLRWRLVVCYQTHSKSNNHNQLRDFYRSVRTRRPIVLHNNPIDSHDSGP